MRVLITALALSGVLAANVQAEPLNCKMPSAAKNNQAACKLAKSKPGRRGSDGVSRADAERNDRAQTRNVLQSIEGELRRRRLGN